MIFGKWNGSMVLSQAARSDEGMLKLMVLLLNGNSENVAQMKKKTGILWKRKKKEFVTCGE